MGVCLDFYSLLIRKKGRDTLCYFIVTSSPSLEQHSGRVSLAADRWKGRQTDPEVWYQAVLRDRAGEEGDYCRLRWPRGIEERRNLCFVNGLQRWPSHVFVSVSLSPSLPLSLTCKWQKDSAMTFVTPPLCFLESPDNCYGNRMSPRSVDWLIRAVSQPDESSDPACLFTSVLVVLLWWHVCRLSVSCSAVMKRVNSEDEMCS